MISEAAIYNRMRERMEAEMSRAFGMTTSQIEPERPPMTADTLLASMRDAVAKLPPAPPSIFYTPNALADSEERLFPASRHRSLRVRKKLLKRFGGEFRRVPTIWLVQGKLFAHPALRASIEARWRA